MTCRQVRDYMRRSSADVGDLDHLPPEVSAHLRSCTGCLAQRRVVWLMRKGSGDGTGEPSPGFEAQLRQRLLEQPGLDSDPSFRVEPMGLIFAGLARPALAAASLIAALSLAAFLSVQAGMFSGGGPDLSLLANTDAHSDTVLDDWGQEP